MLETVTMPRNDLSVKFRGGYRAGSRGRWEQDADDWECTCVNCGQAFPNRRKLKFHYIHCQDFEEIRKVQKRKEEIYFNCTKCSQKFPSKKGVEYHMKRCGKYIGMKQVHMDSGYTNAEHKFDGVKESVENNAILVQEDINKTKGREVEVLDCLKCTESFSNETSLEHHRKRCGKYEKMTEIHMETKKAVKNKAKENKVGEDNNVNEVIAIEDEEGENQEVVAGETINRNSAENKNVERCERPAEYDQLLTSMKNKEFDFKMSDEKREQSSNGACKNVTIEHVKTSVKVETELLKERVIYGQTKRKYDFMTHTFKDDVIVGSKKPRTASGALYKLLQEDILQQQHHDRFDRVSEEQRSYRCCQCNVRFKYKQKYDMHMKYAHIPTSLLIADAENEHMHTENSSDCTNILNQISKKSRDAEAQTSPNGLSSDTFKTANYPCDFCHMGFRHYSRLQRHMKNTHKEQGYLQEFCKIFKCPECCTSTTDKYAMLKHYNKEHFRKGRKSLVNVTEADEKEADDKSEINYIPDVKGIMQHLKRNLLCLQTDKSVGGETSHERIKNLVLKTESKPDDEFERKSESRDNSEVLVDTSQSTANGDDRTKTPVACETKFDTLYYNTDKHDSATEESSLCRKQSRSDYFAHYHVSLGTNENDQPLDLSVKDAEPMTKSAREQRESFSQEKTVVDRKPSEYEKSLLMEYYKDFLHEYGVMTQP